MAAWFDRYADWLCGLVDNVADAANVDIDHAQRRLGQQQAHAVLAAHVAQT
jgi:hypothetical protein